MLASENQWTEIKVELSAFTASIPTYENLGEVTVQTLFENKLLLLKAIEKGIPFSLFKKLQSLMPFSESEWLRFLDISAKSMQRYKVIPDFHFKSSQSDTILEILEIAINGLSLFDSMEAFKLWLHTPNYALGQQKPIDLLANSVGKKLVLDELIRIEFGIFI